MKAGAIIVCGLLLSSPAADAEPLVSAVASTPLDVKNYHTHVRDRNAERYRLHGVSNLLALDPSAEGPFVEETESPAVIAGKYFFLAYVFVSLLAGAKELCVRATQLSSHSEDK